jgi:hypothetical protein
MGFKIHSARETSNMSKNDITASIDLYLNEDQTKAVKQGSQAFSLLARKGRVVPARFNDLVTAGGKPKGAKKAAPKAANKAAPEADNKSK